MPSYAGPSAARAGDVAGTLRLLAYLALSVTLIVLDHRGGWLHQARQQAGLVVGPLLAVAGWPGRMAERLRDDAGTLSQLSVENRRLRNELLVNHARMARMTTVAADNARLRDLLDTARRGSLDVQLAPVLDVDLDPTRQRLLLDAGSSDGVRTGQSVIDAGGLLGQVIDVTPMHSTVLLLTDADHAVPVAIARNGVRLVAYGRGRSDTLALASIPLSSDVKVGDMVVTSGLGARFPPGFPVGEITALRPDESRAFLVGDLRPAAQLDRGRDVLLLRSAPARAPIGPVDANVDPAATGDESGVAATAGQGADGRAAGSNATDQPTTTSTTARAAPGNGAPATEPVNKAANRTTHKPALQPVNKPATPPVNQPVTQPSEARR
ncbi:MAG TPA: rod shape-determining protein MreC [Lysobacter sp.]